MLAKKFLLIMVIALAINSCKTATQADLILHNGTIYTVDEAFSTAEAIAIRGGKIIAVGSTKDMLKKYHSEHSIDLSGRFVYPGLIDAHGHLLSYGQSLREANLVGTKSFDEVVDILKAHALRFPSEWVLGRGWDQNDWEVKEFPVKDKLDEAFPDKPVFLKRVGGHAAMVNSEAMRRAGITAATTIDGGTFVKKDGKLTGVLVNRARNFVVKLIPESTEKEDIQNLLEAQKNIFSVGLTSVHDASTGYRTIEIMDSLQKAGVLKLRIFAMLMPGEENYNHYLYKGIYKTDFMNVRSIKLFADGNLGARGALMLKPYTDDSENYGLPQQSDEFLKEQCRLAFENGYQVVTHCIGDSANRWMLNMYSGYLGGKNDRRWRIEHAQIIHPDDFIKFGDFSIIPSIQSTHATSDMYWAPDRVGQERMKGAYAFRTLLNQNGWLPNGSDFPVENINPLYGYYAIVARKDLNGYPEGGFQMQDAFTREEGLRAMTIWAAKAAFEENEKGSLEPGKFADFIITGEDLVNIPESQIPGVKILDTYIGGELVYTSEVN